MLTRRDWLRTTAAAGAAVTLSPDILQALKRQEMMTRAIPSTGEQVPIVGLGSSATFSRVARGDDVTQLGNVLTALVENGGTIFDTAPSYGSSEEVAGRLASELGITDRIFWATKVNVARRGGGANPADARAQIERSFEYFGVDEIELMQVHNLGDMPVQMPIIQELKGEGRLRYIGTTLTPRGPQYQGLMQAMRDYPLDFIGVDYAVDNTDAADEVLPLAQERGIGVLVYVPFGRTRLWNRVGDREVPDWAREFGANSWAQFFIKFAAAHPAVTCVTPATSNPEHMIDNLGAGLGRMPNEDEQQRMVEYVDALPSG
ncbi:MAG: aldo/keto reductase [Gemmatimonadetes bacterium]|nr:aldo/keto reductase [Gemmatimonadota bacterium]MDE2676274.1 aldo/keto reductase [Gemmatimonadota bacterium]MYA12508.1 aldo/keto reductase [Gemmatimonadota bacterium]MYE69690.1 aldo/keto reductase [Gemmatimonadota bacterium]MYJ67663.1 aldo/keto reductase [Gemmatimonadota bacterium]